MQSCREGQNKLQEQTEQTFGRRLMINSFGALGDKTRKTERCYIVGNLELC